MNLGVLPPLGGGLTTLAAAGQVTRFLNYHIPAYANAFERVFYFSYHLEQLGDFVTLEKSWIEKFRLVHPPRPLSPYVYTMLMVRHAANEMRSCNLLRVTQLTGFLPAFEARIRWRTPYVATYDYRYAEFARMNRHWWSWLALRLLEPVGLRRASAVIATTPALRDYVAQYVPAHRIYLIPNGVDTALFSPAPSPPARPSAGGVRIISVGRLELQKNFEALIEACACLRSEFDIHLTLVGNGSLRAHLERRAQECNVPVKFVGVVPNDQLPHLLREADLFVLPSLTEGHPKALLEAMSVGLPCVGTDVPGIRDVLEDGRTGILAPDPTPTALAAAIRRCLLDPVQAEAYGRAARRQVEERYALPVLLAQEVTLLLDIAQYHSS